MIDHNTACGMMHSTIDCDNFEMIIHEALKKKLRYHVYFERLFASRASRYGLLHGMYDNELIHLGHAPSSFPPSLTAKVRTDPMNSREANRSRKC
jgi:hypothetical protein